ncbi:MAG: ABC transporter substrate-binding protein, partial [Burkholderiaceae bacterium]
MSIFSNPFNHKISLHSRCSCGQHTSEAEHIAAESRALAQQEEALTGRVVEQGILRALFPNDELRRRFLKAVGTPTAMAAVSSLFPMAMAKEAFAAAPGKLEKTKLKVGFIPITCATPIIMAHPMGFYSKQGLDVEVVKTAGWAVVRDKALNKEYDAAHMLSPMPLAISLGAGAAPQPYTMPAVENINGQAITLAMKHKDRRDPKS